FSPAQHPVVRNITPQQIAPIPKPAGAFRPQCPRVESLHRGMSEGIGLEAWVEDPDGRIRVSDRVGSTPIPRLHRYDRVPFYRWCASLSPVRCPPALNAAS